MLPELHKSVQSEGLAAAVEEHLEQTREHGPRLEEVFRALGAEPSSNLDPPVEKLVEHHELSAYDALLTLAQAVELPSDVRGLLERNRAEEAEALRRLQQERDRLVGELGA